MTSAVVAVVVHYRSGGQLRLLLADLARQRGVDLRVLIVENGDDGSVAAAVPELRGLPHDVLRPAGNLGYTGGNNLALRSLHGRDDEDVLILNPDVRLCDRDTVAELARGLRGSRTLAAVGPAIYTPAGRLEHAGALVDPSTARAVHTRTDLAEWPDDLDPDLQPVPWLNGCCLLLRRSALQQIGGLDERYFLFFEEVDWALRAAAAGYRLGIVARARVRHIRSASFGSSRKGAYYYWRNNYLLFSTHHRRARWRRAWAVRLVRFALAPRHLRSGEGLPALHGGLDALLHRWGPRRWPGEA